MFSSTKLYFETYVMYQVWVEGTKKMHSTQRKNLQFGGDFLSRSAMVSLIGDQNDATHLLLLSAHPLPIEAMGIQEPGTVHVHNS